MSTKSIISVLIVNLSLLLTTCGDDDDGDGNGKRRGVLEPSRAVGVAMGGSHACAILKTGKLVCWGDGETSAEVNLGQTVVAVDTGGEHTCAILNDGSLWCWGGNGNGQLGDGTTTDRNAPTAVELGEDRTAVGISLGKLHTCAILDDGSLWCWGDNNSGQVGDGTTTGRNTPVVVDLGANKTALMVSAGYEHTCAILNDNSVKCWGKELGNGVTRRIDAPSPVSLGGNTAVKITAGDQITCAILDNDEVVCWGINFSGQLGNGGRRDSSVTPVTSNLGTNRTALDVSTGHFHVCALLDNNSVVCWGQNTFGQVGDETIVSKNTPTAVDLGNKSVAALQAGGASSCALFEDGSLTCWGSNRHGQLGTGKSGASILSPQTVETGDKTAMAIDGGLGHTCALFEDEDSNVFLWCWGENDVGQVGTSDSVTRLVPTSIYEDDVSFTTGYKHTCALGTNNLVCWGENGAGQLGVGDTINRFYTNLAYVNLGTNKSGKAISAGNEHTCAILNDDKIKCWGKGGSGRLGNGGASDSSTPVAVTMGDSVTAVKISAGREHTCAIFNDNKVYCWGRNNGGQLGIGSTTDSTTPSVLDLGTDKTATTISAGNNHSCAILNDNSVKCWGTNSFGQLGDGSKTRRTSPIAVNLGTNRTATAIHAKGDYTCAILDNGSLKCWGRNSVGQLGDGTTTNRNTPTAVDLGAGRTATAMGGGNTHNCAILDDKSLKCWGYNNHGQTGLPTGHRGDQPGEMGDNLIYVDLGG